MQIAQQIDNLRLYGHIERACRLVQHDEFGLQHHGAGDGDALALAAGKLVRVAILRLRVKAHFLQRPADAGAPLVVVQIRVLDQQALFDDLANRKPWRQRSVGVLENHLHFFTQRPHLR